MDHNETQIRKFMRNLLNDAPDLSALTLGSLKLQYMSHLGCESLSPEAKICIKRVVEEELLNMQISGTDVSESENARVVASSKRKRGKDEKDDSGRSVDEDELSAKKICRRYSSSVKAGKGKHVELNGTSFETGRAVSEEEEQVDQHGDKDQGPVQESEEDQEGAEEQMNLSDKPQYREGPAGDSLAGKHKVSKGGRRPRSRKRQTKASSDEENESSSLSDDISEEEDRDSTKKGAPGNKLDGKQTGSKGGGGPGSGKQQAKSSTDEEKESSSQSDESSEVDHNVPKKEEAPGNKLDSKQKSAMRGGKTGSGKQQAKASAVKVKRESSSSQSSEESEEGEKYKKGKEPGGKLEGKQKVDKRRRKTVPGKQQTKAPSDEEKQPLSPQSDEDGKEDKHPKKNTPEQDGGNSDDADSDKEEKLPTMTTKEDDQDPDSSSSLTSLEEEKDSTPAMKLTIKKGDKKKRREDDSKRETDENKAVLRLKRYISLCGARRNYKKLFEGCRSIRSKVSILKKELEDLGVEGLPSIEKCKKARMKREDAQELAELDVSNIITTQGRPKRRGSSAWTEQQSSPAARYKRTVNSDSDEGSPTEKGPNRSRHWGNLQGIISEDGESD